jgi:acetophenone carboxylase
MTCFSQGMFMAGARMTYHLDPLRAVAAWYTAFGIPVYGGINQWGEPISDVSAEMNATGAGGRPDMDGVDCAGSFFATMSDCSDVETTEADRPFLYMFRNYTKHSYGHGKYRGGSGVGFGLMMHHVPWVAMGAFGYGSKFPPTAGIFGGYAAPPVFIETVRGSNAKALLEQGHPDIPRTMDQLYESDNPEQGTRQFHHISNTVAPYMNGDTFYVPVGGGAGYGDSLERDPEAVVKDLREGATTHWAVEQMYKVACDPGTFRLDLEKTAELRAAARAERKRRGLPYAEFVAEWEQLRPAEEVLHSYGTYPHPSEGIAAGSLLPRK